MPTHAAPGFLGLGQATARGLVVGAARHGRLGRTLLVHGPGGVGADAFVDDVLALLLCADPDSERRPCNACRGCRDARARSHPDLLIGSPARWRESRSAGESIVAAARRWLADAAGAPMVAERRIVLIEGADTANEQTQNALLKALEEPNRRQMFILTATDPARLLPTIRSRCQSLRLGPVPRDDLVAWIVDHNHLPRDQALAVARIADGMAGTAARYAAEPDRVAWRRRVQAELLELLWRGRQARFSSARDLVAEAARRVTGVEQEEPPADEEAGARAAPAQQRQAALLVLEAWIDLARDLVVAASGRLPLAGSAELVDGLADAARRVPAARAAAAVRQLERIREGLEANAAPRLAMSVAMLAWPTLDEAA